MSYTREHDQESDSREKTEGRNDCQRSPNQEGAFALSPFRLLRLALHSLAFVNGLAADHRAQDLCLNHLRRQSGRNVAIEDDEICEHARL